MYGIRRLQLLAIIAWIFIAADIDAANVDAANVDAANVDLFPPGAQNGKVSADSSFASPKSHKKSGRKSYRQSNGSQSMAPQSSTPVSPRGPQYKITSENELEALLDEALHPALRMSTLTSTKLTTPEGVERIDRTAEQQIAIINSSSKKRDSSQPAEHQALNGIQKSASIKNPEPRDSRSHIDANPSTSGSAANSHPATPRLKRTTSTRPSRAESEKAHRGKAVLQTQSATSSAEHTPSSSPRQQHLKSLSGKTLPPTHRKSMHLTPTEMANLAHKQLESKQRSGKAKTRPMSLQLPERSSSTLNSPPLGSPIYDPKESGRHQRHKSHQVSPSDEPLDDFLQSLLSSFPTRKPMGALPSNTAPSADSAPVVVETAEQSKRLSEMESSVPPIPSGSAESKVTYLPPPLAPVALQDPARKSPRRKVSKRSQSMTLHTHTRAEFPDNGRVLTDGEKQKTTRAPLVNSPMHSPP